MLATVLKLILMIVQWVWGDKLMRAQRAKEIVDLLTKVTKDGDVLAGQIHKEMSQFSDTDWEDIHVRLR